MVALDLLGKTNQARRSWPAADRLRRVVDLGLAGALLVFLAPLIVLVALAILTEDGPPVVFSQTRIGQDGVPFGIFKFRKFHNHCGSGGLPLTHVRDPRLTRIGRILRASKLDELPQLWNVLRGDMAIVGPRPESMVFADAFGDLARVLEHKPGILGPSQAVFHDESALFADEPNPTALYRRVFLPAKARIDIEYYENRTLWKDLGWIATTLMVTIHLGTTSAQRLHVIQNEPEVIRRMKAAGMLKGGDGLL